MYYQLHSKRKKQLSTNLHLYGGIKMRKIGTYSPTDKIHSSLSIDRVDEKKWIAGRVFLQSKKQSIGDYILEKFDEDLEKQVVIV